MSVFDVLTADLSWRESELGALKILLKKKDLTKTQKEVLLRASWALLYAHYEGFSKFCLTAFYDEATKRLLDCERLPDRTKLFALQKHIKKLKNLTPLEMLSEIEKFKDFVKNTAPSFPDVDTKSNLWPNVMEDLLLDADINIDAVNSHSNKIRTLVSRRNDIAHGHRSIIDDVEYYLTFENAIYDVMYNLAYSIDTRLSQPPYAP